MMGNGPRPRGGMDRPVVCACVRVCSRRAGPVLNGTKISLVRSRAESTTGQLTLLTRWIIIIIITIIIYLHVSISIW